MDATAKTEDTKPAEKRENENGTAESTENGEQQPAKKVKIEEADKDQIKVGVLPEGFPDDVMTQDQVEKVKEAILDKIIEMDDSQVKPKFLRAINRSDYLALTCANEDTLTWLENEISSIQPWEDCKLKIEKGDSFPTSEVLYADLPKSQDYTTEKMLKLIDGQNEGLSATSWKVVSKSTGGTMVELIVKVPPAIMQKLKEMDYKVNYKFGTVRIGPKEKPKAPPKASGGKPKQRLNSIRAPG
ncbi:unnamed protein product [Acanthoscelides obtectus]|uniref:DUF4780 domain-containing protein n=1 Tax=Acanthoscelides obtectus TaxID=200917 RepID=A0A9P0KAD3_ACAOB|nr:unnamed protein product [Acanthoscelides obtectus]CAK1676504.1 hypothetical protein AOBTE_LOCUS30790 [Acanthoscelides obtectus]